MAIMAVRHDWIRWPDEDQRKEISEAMAFEGFPGCIDFIDGTTIPLSLKNRLKMERLTTIKSR